MSDSATWVAVGLAIGAASLALVAALVVLLVVMRGRRSSYAEVEQLLRDSLERSLHLSAGIAQLRQDDDATSFFERADEALYQAKEAGKGQFTAADEVG
jgi:GGDEF domain-containing protein